MFKTSIVAERTHNSYRHQEAPLETTLSPYTDLERPRLPVPSCRRFHGLKSPSHAAGHLTVCCDWWARGSGRVAVSDPMGPCAFPCMQQGRP